MKRIDRLHLEMPYAGSRMLRDLLALEHILVGRKHVATLMQRMSMDGKGAWRDNVFVKPLWRSVKYEKVYLHAYETVSDSSGGLRCCFDLMQRPCSTVKRPTADLGHSDVGMRNSRR